MEPKLITRPRGMANSSVRRNSSKVVPKPSSKDNVTSRSIANLFLCLTMEGREPVSRFSALIYGK